MRNTITTVRDLRNWVDAATNGWHERGDNDVDTITEAIRSGDHPAWGDDWSEFFESLPDLTEYLN